MMSRVLLLLLILQFAFVAPRTIKLADLAPDGPLTEHFQTWLRSNGYGDENFERSDYGTKGSYGGKVNDAHKVLRTPVIFIHGNSDSALGAGEFAGWINSIDYFTKMGYTSSEMYATSWGDDNPDNADKRTHDCKTLARLRRFVIAVQNYTQSTKIHMIAHSMGVTLGRKVILGGTVTADDGNCDLGVPLRYFDVFVGLAGANYGLCHCIWDTDQTTCNHQNGYWPGDSCGQNTDCGAAELQYPCNGPVYNQYMMDLNGDYQQLAKRVVSAWSTADDLIQFGDNIWGRPTSLIPRSTDQKIYPNYTHMETKESTMEDQYNWVNRII